METIARIEFKIVKRRVKLYNPVLSHVINSSFRQKFTKT